jgi:hypothetical protein
MPHEASPVVREREIGHSLNKDEHGPVWLDQLDPDRGDYPTEIVADCSILCAIAEPSLTAVDLT